MIKDIVARREFENEYREIFVDFENLELEELKQLAKDIQYLTNKFKYFAIMEEINQDKSKFPKKDEKFNEFWLNKCENPFLNKLRIKWAKNDIEKATNQFQKEIEELQTLKDIKDPLKKFSENLSKIQQKWLKENLWENLDNEELFDEENYKDFINVLDEYKNYVVYGVKKKSVKRK